MFKGNIAQAMQMAQRMQDSVKKAQEELATLEVTGQAGGGMVSVTLSGRMEARRVRIDPQALTDAEMLEDLIAAAINDAVNKANEESGRRMSAATAGMPIPPGLKGMFGA
ncbi:YbaB/EbfC family nucleoid-associated protein [Silanimonas sp.]|uniref:YbaB/EbfC family nucleoid-associated protein n=1 Tax=Silanimonas sp. TaxID=1929290 RepID=UPI001BC73692|nr:YbaB/EbfC family nucleoid-associated protein [Silanimonas sp.]MBS3895580.1 YbaB/EbfC family nucleoid-associated protein [Silanimonas sp.]MBS3924337.1 YbaB/EbfC family nucleoid-associated protein [Xanthomonadaceae bacterium]